MFEEASFLLLDIFFKRQLMTLVGVEHGFFVFKVLRR